ncbi:MAG: hypothetical protein HZB19_18475 [Chloroflexi bacterium]|nr:hypothetical protein [Chloroflexota bacterium]
MRPATDRPLTFLLLLGICFFPLLATLGLAQFNPPDTSASEPFTIDLKYNPTDEPGVADKLEVTAPPNMELAVYLNDRLLDVVKTDALGKYFLDMPVLPQRRNEIAALPTQIDPSTLPLFYDPTGFQKLNVLPAHTKVEAPFLAALVNQEDGLHLYGSAAPMSRIEIGRESCSSIALVEATSDEEGSFHAILPDSANDTPIKTFCLSVIPQAEVEAADQFLVAAPTFSPARGEGVWERSVDLQFSATDVRLIFSVEMPDGYLIYRNLAGGNISESQFLEYVFGKVTLNTFLDPRLMTWRQEKQAGSDRVRVLIETQPLAYLIAEDTATVFQLDTHELRESIPPYKITDTVTATLDGVRGIKNSPTPSASEGATQTWRGALASTPTLTFWVSRNPNPPADPIGRARLRDAISKIVSSLQIQPSPLLRETLEGQIVGLLPARVPAAVQAQVYDTYRAVYLADPFTDTLAARPTFQTFLRDLPSRVPDWITNLLFGALWVIPSALMLWTLQKENALDSSLACLASGIAALVLLTINWLPLMNRIELDREAYIHWLTAGLLTFEIFFLPLPSWTRWLAQRPTALFALLVLAAPVSAFAADFALALLPDGWVSALLTGLSLLGFFSLIWLASQAGSDRAKPPSAGIAVLALLIVFGLSLPIQSLPLSAQLSGALGVSTFGVALIRPLLPLALLLGITMTLRRKHDRSLGGKMSSLERGYARVILVAFAVGLSPAWGFIPLSIVIGLIMFEWLVPMILLPPDNTAHEFVNKHHSEGVKQTLLLNRQTRLWRATESNMQKQVREGKMEDENYRTQREKLEKSARELERPKYLKTQNSAITLRDLGFNFGAGPNHRDNLKHALAWGVLLAAPMLLIHGWPLAAAGIEQALPFPFLNTAIRLAAFAAQYLASAVFLGYFFPYVRGRNGLEKGGWLALTIVLAFLPYHLLYASSISDWTAILIWAGSVLAYNLLIGLLAFDIRTLTRFNLGWSRLPDLYDFGTLAVYLTGSGVPLITTTFTAIFGSLEELVPSILKVMFPSFTLSSAQFELLQMLLDLASRIASGVLK